MSIITNNLPVTNEDVTFGQMNSLFSDIQTATTAALSSPNLAHESIDIQQFNLVAGFGNAGINLIKSTSSIIGAVLPGVTVNAVNGVSPAATTVQGELSFGAAGLVLASTDILRVYWRLGINTITYGAGFPAGSSFENPANNHCWVTYLQQANSWSGVGPTGWGNVTNQGDFTATLSSPAGSFGGDYQGERINNIRGSAMAPHTLYGKNAAGAVTRCGQQIGDFNGQYYRMASAGTIYGLRLQLIGLLWGVRDTGTEINYLARDNGLTYTDSLTYGQGNITAIHMRAF